MFSDTISLLKVLDVESKSWNVCGKYSRSPYRASTCFSDCGGQRVESSAVLSQLCPESSNPERKNYIPVFFSWQDEAGSTSCRASPKSPGQAQLENSDLCQKYPSALQIHTAQRHWKCVTCVNVCSGSIRALWFSHQPV